MPAVSVNDILVLPRLSTLDPATTRHRPVRRLVTAARGYEGESFLVRRGFAGVPLFRTGPVR